jgi:hypothetical protein
LGCPKEAGERLKEASISPSAILLTRVAAPGLSTLGKEKMPLVVRQAPLRFNGLEAEPIQRTHGWDYVIKADDVEVLFTERGDVSAADVEGYTLAIIGNKYRADAFADTVITQPWPQQEWVLSEKHQPGKHSQKTHGRSHGGGASSGGVDVRKTLLETFPGAKGAVEMYADEASENPEEYSSIDENALVQDFKEYMDLFFEDSAPDLEMLRENVVVDSDKPFELIDTIGAGMASYDYSRAYRAARQLNKSGYVDTDIDDFVGDLQEMKEFRGRLKVWSSMDAVPDQFKEMEGAKLTLAQANFIARVAEASGKDGEENWAIAVSQFKKSYTKKGNTWTRNKKPAVGEAEKELIISRLDELRGYFRQQFPSTPEYGCYVTDADPEAMYVIVSENSNYYAVSYELDERGVPVFAAKEAWEPAYQMWVRGTHAMMMTEEPMMAKMSPNSYSFKDMGDGTYRWYSLTTNDSWDLQDERVPHEAVSWSLMISSLMNDRGDLLFRHLPLKIGKCDKQVQTGPLLFESGLTDPIDQNPIAKAVVELANSEPGHWKISPGLRFKETDLLPDGTYKRCWIRERSVTDRPANPTTAFAIGRTPMKITDTVLQEAADQLGLPVEQVKQLAQEYLDANKEYPDLDTALKEMAEGALIGFGTQTKAKKTPPPDEDEDEEDMEEEEEEEEAPPPYVKKKRSKEDQRIVKLLEQNTRALNAVTAALTAMANGQHQGVTKEVQKALEEYLETAPRAEAAKFASGRKEQSDGAEDDVRKALKEVSQKLDKLTSGRSAASFEELFTSQELNAPRGGAQ